MLQTTPDAWPHLYIRGLGGLGPSDPTLQCSHPKYDFACQNLPDPQTKVTHGETKVTHDPDAQWPGQAPHCALVRVQSAHVCYVSHMRINSNLIFQCKVYFALLGSRISKNSCMSATCPKKGWLLMGLTQPGLCSGCVLCS